MFIFPPGFLNFHFHHQGSLLLDGGSWTHPIFLTDCGDFPVPGVEIVPVLARPCERVPEEPKNEDPFRKGEFFKKMKILLEFP